MISAHLGIFKGMLTSKQGIGTIQLFSSMKKVGKSKARKELLDEGVYLVVIGMAPSIRHNNHERALNLNLKKSPTKSSTSLLKSIPPSVESVLIGYGVESELINSYNERANNFHTCMHSFLVGVSDCTDGGIPEGTLFIPGLDTSKGSVKVLITRVPCTETKDMLLLPLLSSKPHNMTSQDWTHLCSLPFGVVMFGSPANAQTKSLPEMINNSDLDGDNFCVIWDADLVSCVEKSYRNDGGMTVNDNERNESNLDEELDDSSLDEEEEDPLCGYQVPIKIGGSVRQFIVQYELEDGNYLLKCGDFEEQMTKEEILCDKECVDSILAHNGKKGRHAEVQVKWCNGHTTWEPLQSIQKDVPDILADYALNNDLLEEKAFAWAKAYCRDAEIVEICDHKYEAGMVKFIVIYDGEQDTKEVNSDHVDISMAAKYAKQKGIVLENKAWDWLREEIEDAEKTWFENVQATLVDIDHMAEHDRLIKRLSALHKRTIVESGMQHEDSIALGRAFKNSLDVGKHGGRVPLPQHLRENLTAKSSAYTKFVKLESAHI